MSQPGQEILFSEPPTVDPEFQQNEEIAEDPKSPKKPIAR
jgi:hypothetical protein